MKKHQRRTLSPQAVIYACLIYLFLYLPIFVVVAFSFNSSKMNIVFEGFTFEWYWKMFENRSLMDALKNTLIVAAASTGLSVVIGTIAAVGMYKFHFRMKNVVNNALYIPVVIPEIVLGISLLAFFSLVGVQMGMGTLIISHVTFSLPFVVITLRSRLAGYDKSMEEAAMDPGSQPVADFSPGNAAHPGPRHHVRRDAGTDHVPGRCHRQLLHHWSQQHHPAH